MKLRETLKNFKGEKVKIGSSSSFVFCGMVDDDITATLDVLSQYEMQKKLKAYELRTKKSRVGFCQLWAKKMNEGLRTLRMQSRVEGWTKEQHEAKVKEFIKDFDEQKKADQERRQSGEAAREYFKAWVGFLDRNVKEEYESMEGGYIIIIDGNEIGEYWTYEEYERRWKDDEAHILQTEG